MTRLERKIEKVCFIAPSTCLSRSDKKALNRTIGIIKKLMEVNDVHLSPYLFSSDGEIDHVTAPLTKRLEDFKSAIREHDLIISVTGGTGAEDVAFKIDKKDYSVIKKRRPIFVGFSDFTFLLNEIYYASGIPVIYFASLKLGKGNFKKIFALISGEEISYKGSAWLTPPPARKFSGIPIGGNLSTFVNFLNRCSPPQLNWKKYILFMEDIKIDVEDLHRLFAALRRHKVFDKIRCLVVGSLSEYSQNDSYKKHQKEALSFIKIYLKDILLQRRQKGDPLPILTVSNFGHSIRRDLMAIPLGGYVSISKGKKIIFAMAKPRRK